ncbi:histamine N-methyltransferase-like isoform X2 [Apostichopus japonicus]
MTSLKMSQEDTNHFNECHEAFALREKALDTFTDWASTVFRDAVVSKIALDYVKDGNTGRKRLEALGVGSGSGEIDIMFLEQMVKKYSNIYFTSLELSSENTALFKSKVSRGTIENVTWDWKQLSWDNYRFYNVKSREPKLFHFICTVHSLIYIRDVDQAVMNMYESLDDGGVLLMIVASEESGSYKLRTKFPQLYIEDGLSHVSSAEVRKILKTHGIPHQILSQPSRVDITTVFQKGRKEGSQLVDHLSKRVNFLKTASPRMVNEFISYLKSPQCSEREQQSYLLVNDWDAFIVTK